jgi:hypothetical protein
LKIWRSTNIYDLRIRWIRSDAGIGQRLEDLHQIVLGQPDGKEVLAHQNIIFLDAAERISVVIPPKRTTSRRRQRRVL